MLYLIIQENFVKVGYTSNVKHRFEQYKSMNPTIQKFDDVTEGELALEDLVHKEFFDANENFSQCEDTEWYRCDSPDLLDTIKKGKLTYILNETFEQVASRNTEYYSKMKDEINFAVFDDSKSFSIICDRMFAKRKIHSVSDRLDFYRSFIADLLTENRKLYAEIEFWKRSSELFKKHFDFEYEHEKEQFCNEYVNCMLYDPN